MRLIKGVAALLVLMAGMIAVPTFLVIFVGNPLPADLDWARFVAGLTRPDDGSILLGLIAIVAWIAWVILTVSVLAETVALLSRHSARITIPGLAAPRRLVSGLVVAAFSLTVVVSPQLTHAEPVRPLPQVAPEQVDHRPADAPAAQHAVRPAAASERVAEAPRVPARGPAYTVQRGDDLWSLAERFYGEGREWRTIAAANPQVLSGGPDRLEAGWRLVIPATDDAAGDRSPGHRVERGDTLTSIAEQELGDGSRWRELFEANRFQLDDADELPVGLRLQLPRQATPEAPAEKSLDRPIDSASGSAPATPPTTPTADQDHSPLDSPPDDDVDALPKPPAEPAAPGEDSAPPAGNAPATPQIPTRESDPAPSAGEGVVDPVVAGLAGVGGLLAAAVVAGASRRRRAQLQVRPVGRRIRPPSRSAQLAETHLGRRQQPMGLRSLDLATRAIAAHCHHSGDPLPELVTATVHGDRLELEMAEPAAGSPAGFVVEGTRWRLDAGDVDRLRSTPGLREAVRPYPALVTLGSTADEAQVVGDLEALRLTSVDSTEPELATAALAALAVELSCSPWAEELELILVGTCEALPDALGRHTVTRVDDLESTLERLAPKAASQRRQRVATSIAAQRVDPDLADPWVPTILIINRSLSAGEQRRLRSLVLAEPAVSIAAVGVGLDQASCRLVVSGSRTHPVARIEPDGVVVTPQLLSEVAAAAVIDLVEATGRTDTLPAPWWYDANAEPEPDPPDNVTYLGRRFGGWTGPRHHDQDDEEQEGAAMDRQTSTTTIPETSHPLLRLLGPVELDGAAGVAPPRAARQCLEYCAWLLEHPGTKAQAMATALAVAEGTRRSNMSRLRSWLGADELDQPYLPDAYSGRIMLHPSVSSDWQRLQILTGRGVNLTSSSGLQAALRLVRGAPIADAAPGQWHWAEGLRTDMISVVRDIGVELADRALADGDVELARWAATRALAAAPGDELLLVARIKTEHRAGNGPEVERLTLHLAAQARSLEVDLRAETVDVLQEMMEGRVRARLA